VCIKCENALERRDISGVEVDVCPNCGGVWLDHGELQQLAQRPADLGAMVNQIQFNAADQKLPRGDDPRKPCPACGGKLGLASWQNVTLEHCSACDGLFVDRGELENAMREFQSAEARTIVAIAKSVTMSGRID
jgi:Zn-finger nucleic acid-binding protein